MCSGYLFGFKLAEDVSQFSQRYACVCAVVCERGGRGWVTEDVREVLCRLDHEISRRGSRHRDLVGEKLYRFTVSDTFCAGDIYFVAPVMLSGGANIPSVYGMW